MPKNVFSLGRFRIFKRFFGIGFSHRNVLFFIKKKMVQSLEILFFTNKRNKIR